MLLWRIGANALSTKENLMLSLGASDSNFTLCGEAVELSIHLF